MKLVWRGKTHEVKLDRGNLRITPEGEKARTVEVSVNGNQITTPEGTFPFAAVRDRHGIWVCAAGHTEHLEFAKPVAASGSGSGEVRSPMTGKVVSVNVSVGDSVEKGDVVAVVSAMKMEFRVEAPRAGTVTSVEREADQLVELGNLLIRIEDSQ